MEDKKNILIISLKIVAILFLAYLLIVNAKLLIDTIEAKILKNMPQNTTNITDNNYDKFWEKGINWFKAPPVVKPIVPSMVFNIIVTLAGIIEIIISFTKKKLNKYVIWVTLVLVIISLFLPIESISDPYELQNSIHYIYYSIEDLFIYR